MAWKESIMLSLVVVGMGLSAAAADDPSYLLEPWPFGAIAWVEERPENAEALAAGLADAVREVFGLWELPPPDAMRGWEDPSQVKPNWQEGGALPQVLKKDPETNALWRLTPLSWNDTTIYPLLFIGFPTRRLLARGMGGVAWSAVYIQGRAAIAGSAVWFQTLTGVPSCIAAPIQDAEMSTWHELSHWMTYCVLEREEVGPWRVPDWIIEGIAEYTEASLAGVAGWKTYAAEWAEENRLAVDLDPYDTYRIGLAVVAYLVETGGARGFIASLDTWATEPEGMIRNIEGGWRAWLGVGV